MPAGTTGPRIVFPPAGITFPATGINPSVPVNAFSITNPYFADSLGATVGSPLVGRSFIGKPYRRFRSNSIVVPYPYPVYVGSYGLGNSGYGNGYAPDQEQPSLNMNPAGQTPPVIINQNFVPDRGTPVIRDYTEDTSAGVRVYDAPSREPVDTSADAYTSYYLIAFKDHSIYSAFAYWVEGD